MSVQTALEECPGCGVAAGASHDEHCDHAVCPDCGEQLLLHDCPQWPEGVYGPDRAALWHGVNPLAEVARARNWWTSIVGIDEPVEDFTRVLFAVALDQVAWDPRAQRYAIGRIDEAVLDRELAAAWPPR